MYTNQGKSFTFFLMVIGLVTYMTIDIAGSISNYMQTIKTPTVITEVQE
jgi:hypothetical protein